MCEPPEQLKAAVDDIEIAVPLRRAGRVTREVEDICLNRVLLSAAQRLAVRLRPSFVYQRYDAFMTCGMELSASLNRPLVLEWNGSALWARHNWRTRHRGKEVFDRVLRDIEHESLIRSLVIRAVSTRAAEMAVECGADRDRVVAIANGVDVAAIPPPVPNDNSAGSPTIGWVGSFGPWHGAPVVVEAMARLPGVRAVLVGDGAQRDDCLALATRLGVDRRIEWTGALRHDEAVARMSACDLLVSPPDVPPDGQSFFGSPTKIFEFMAIGRPIVASGLEQIAEVLVDGHTAKLVRPGDVEDFAAGVRDVLSSPDRGRGLGLAARAEVAEYHTWDRRAQDLLERLSRVDPGSHRTRVSLRS